MLRSWLKSKAGALTSHPMRWVVRYSLALYSVDTASNVQRAGPFTVVVGSGIFTPAAAPAPSASGASTTLFSRSFVCMLLMWVVAVSLC